MYWYMKSYSLLIVVILYKLIVITEPVLRVIYLFSVHHFSLLGKSESDALEVAKMSTEEWKRIVQKKLTGKHLYTLL